MRLLTSVRRQSGVSIFHMNPTTESLPDIQRAATEAIARAIAASDATRTELLKEAARNFINARAHFFTREGEPDWLGRTYAYRTWVREVMSAAHVPGNEVSSLQAAIRYHSGNLLRERLDGDEIEDLGLRKESPRERSIEKRSRTSNMLGIFSGGAEISDAEEIQAACAMIEAALARVNAATIKGMPTKARRETKAALLRVAERAEELAG